MTTTPITNLFPGMVPGQTGASTDQSGTPGAGDTFLALVQGLLDEATAQPVVDPTVAAVPGAPADPSGAVDLTGLATAPVVEGTEAEVPVDPAIAPSDQTTAAAAIVPVLVPHQLQLQAAASGQAQPMAPEATAPIEAVTSVASAAVAATTTRTAAAVAPHAVKVAPPTNGDQRPVAPPADGPVPAVQGSTASPVELPDVAVTAAEEPATTAAPTQSATPSTQTANQAPAQAPAVAPVSGTAPVALASAVAPATTDTSQVTQQVFPEVVRVVNNPGGPQRLTIKLNPEALGEVRVVLTSGRNGLEVSLAAGSDAAAAISDGAGELQRLLDVVGRGDARIVVRELFSLAPGTTVSQPATPTPATGAGVPNDLTGGAGAGAGRPGGDASPGQQSQSHTPGTNAAATGAPGTTNPSLPTETGTRAHSGLDVTM